MSVEDPHKVTTERVDELIELLKSPRPEGLVFQLDVLDPDLFEASHYCGETVFFEGVEYIHRGLQAWLDLAEVSGHVLLTPRSSPRGAHLLRLSWRRLTTEGWHETGLSSGDPEKYGIDTPFHRIIKEEEPHFWVTFQDALRWVGIDSASRILSLGVNSGRELAACVAPFLSLSADPQSESGRSVSRQWVGVDHSSTAIEAAQSRYPDPRFDWRVGDLRELSSWDLPPFDLILCLNTLQSPNIDEYKEIKYWVKHQLTHQGALLISLPNSRYLGTHQRFGTYAEHRGRPEQSKLYKRIVGLQRYLHQHHFDVRITGKYTLFVCAKRRVR